MDHSWAAPHPPAATLGIPTPDSRTTDLQAIYQGFARANLPGSNEQLEGEEGEARGRAVADTGFMDAYYFVSMGEYGSGADVYASDSFG